MNKSQVSALSVVTSGSEKWRKESEEGEVSVEGGSLQAGPALSHCTDESRKATWTGPDRGLSLKAEQN